MFSKILAPLNLLLVFFFVFNLFVAPLKTEAAFITPEQIQLEYMNTPSKQIVQSGLELELKNMLIRKILQENLNDRKFEVTHTELSQNSLIISLSNVTPDELIDAGKSFSQPKVARPIIYFNIAFLKSPNGWQGVLDSELSSLKISSNNNLKTEEKQSLENVKKVSSNAASTNRYRDYKFPWPAGEAWTTEISYNNEPWGWHQDHVGWALDFLPPANASLNILASSPGVVEWICTTDDSRNQAGVHIRTVADGIDYGESLRYYHIRKDMLAVGYQSVSQGQYLGRLKEGGNTGYPGCNLYSYNTHLHLGFPIRDFQIDGVVFDPVLSMQWKPLYSTQGFLKNRKVLPHSAGEDLDSQVNSSSSSNISTQPFQNSISSSQNTQTITSSSPKQDISSINFQIDPQHSNSTQSSISSVNSSTKSNSNIQTSSNLSPTETKTFSSNNQSNNWGQVAMILVFFPPVSVLGWIAFKKVSKK